MQRKDFDALVARVALLERYLRALGLPVAPWTSPQQAADLLNTSRNRITAEIKKAEHARIHKLKYDLAWSVHYRKNGEHWQVNPVELEKVIFLPPDQRPYIELST